MPYANTAGLWKELLVIAYDGTPKGRRGEEGEKLDLGDLGLFIAQASTNYLKGLDTMYI